MRLHPCRTASRGGSRSSKCAAAAAPLCDALHRQCTTLSTHSNPGNNGFLVQNNVQISEMSNSLWNTFLDMENIYLYKKLYTFSKDLFIVPTKRPVQITVQVSVQTIFLLLRGKNKSGQSESVLDPFFEPNSNWSHVTVTVTLSHVTV